MISRQDFRANENSVVDGHLVKQLFGSGLAWLEINKDRVNQLNVFPVPDGDTGTNMWLTMRHAYNEIAHVDEPHVGRLSRAIADGALRGARGNSGVILSQLWSGVADVLEGHETLDAGLLVQASRSAVDKAYASVEKPVEGTILTVSRGIMQAVIDHSSTRDLIALLRRMVFAGRTSLRQTPELLPVLKKAGVVDSGGQGLVLIFEGMLYALCGRNVIAEAATHAYTVPQTTWQDALEPEDAEGYGYDVQFLMRGDSLSVEAVKAALHEMGGWSTLVVGDPRLIKVHVHLHDPGQALSYAIKSGARIDDVVVENMQEQYEHYVQERLQHEKPSTVRTDVEGTAVIAVASGAGLRQMFEQLGAAYVIDGGQTLNPSTGDFLEGIDALPNHDVILLPNNKNILLAARQAAESAHHKNIAVIPTTTLPQGISAMFEYTNFTPEDAFSEIVDGMTGMLTSVRTCEITTATRSVELEGVHVRQGQWIGLLDDVLVAAGDDMTALAIDLLEKAQADNFERITLYYGVQSDAAQASALADHLKSRFTGQDIEVVNGGQPLYPYILSVE
jgi:DAK2 domain fusion protein YloV